jgi:hypothetical protein
MLKDHDHYAFPDVPEIETVMRFGAVKRWHMIDTVRTQTLAEHSANVALLAFTIAVTAPAMYFGPAEYSALAGLLHDLPEVFTGDIPSPTKPHIQGLDEHERRVLPAIFQRDVEPHVSKMVKICDLAEGLRFLNTHGPDGLITHHARNSVRNRFFDLLQEVELVWPAEVFDHVRTSAEFYSREAGNRPTTKYIKTDERTVAPDMARGPRNITGGAGYQLCNVDAGMRDGLARIESKGHQQVTDQYWNRAVTASVDRNASSQGPDPLPGVLE